MGNGQDGDLYRWIFEKGVGQQIVKDLPLVVLFALVFDPLLAVSRAHILGFIELDDHLIMQTIQACWDGIKRYIKRYGMGFKQKLSNPVPE